MADVRTHHQPELSHHVHQGAAWLSASDKGENTAALSYAAFEADDSGAGGLRFRAKGFAAHRRRLGLSAAQAGALLGVSGQSIYHWEAGKAKPRASQMPAIASLRKLNKTQAAAAVAQVMG